VTEFEDQGVDFREVDRVYLELKQRQESGGLTQEEFDEQLKQLMVQDEEGRWWVKSRKTGEWHYYAGTTWIKDTPPGYEPIQGGPSTTPPQAPTSPRTILPSWLVPVASVGLVAFVGLVIIVIAIARNTGGDSDQAHGGGGSASNPTPPSIDLPFSDDFSNTSSAWPQEKDEGIYYKDGGYRVSAPAQNLLAVSPSETDTYQDVAVEVEAEVLNSQTDRIAAGVVCRRQDRDNYYGMIVFGNGKVSIVQIRDARLSQIEEDDRSEVISENVGSPHVHIRGHCVGNTLTLYVDNKEVIKAEDSEFESGYVGLIAYSEDSNASADILFDNFSVKKP
jgi:hypothetical protein